MSKFTIRIDQTNLANDLKSAFGKEGALEKLRSIVTENHTKNLQKLRDNYIFDSAKMDKEKLEDIYQKFNEIVYTPLKDSYKRLKSYSLYKSIKEGGELDKLIHNILKEEKSLVRFSDKFYPLFKIDKTNARTTFFEDVLIESPIGAKIKKLSSLRIHDFEYGLSPSSIKNIEEYMAFPTEPSIDKKAIDDVVEKYTELYIKDLGSNVKNIDKVRAERRADIYKKINYQKAEFMKEYNILLTKTKSILSILREAQSRLKRSDSQCEMYPIKEFKNFQNVCKDIAHHSWWFLPEKTFENSVKNKINEFKVSLLVFSGQRADGLLK